MVFSYSYSNVTGLMEGGKVYLAMFYEKALIQMDLSLLISSKIALS